MVYLTDHGPLHHADESFRHQLWRMNPQTISARCAARIRTPSFQICQIHHHSHRNLRFASRIGATDYYARGTGLLKDHARFL